MEVGRTGVPFEQPLHPAVLLPIFLLDSIEMEELVLQMISESPTILIKAPLIRRFIQHRHLPE
jgi:hypothetical protein